MSLHHEVDNLCFSGTLMVLTIDGKERRFELTEISDVLAQASDEERETFEVSPSGYGIHWPLLDEDLSIDGLLGILHSPDQERKHEPRT